jgi:hypothetical protein
LIYFSIGFFELNVGFFETTVEFTLRFFEFGVGFFEQLLHFGHGILPSWFSHRASSR